MEGELSPHSVIALFLSLARIAEGISLFGVVQCFCKFNRCWRVHMCWCLQLQLELVLSVGR
jgi:hypothetical protein